MAIYNQAELQAASDSTYVSNGAQLITAATVRTLNDSWISSSALLRDNNTFEGNQIINGNLTVTGSLTATVATASFAQTASFLLGTVQSASYALTASYVDPLKQNLIVSGGIFVSGSSELFNNFGRIEVFDSNGSGSTVAASFIGTTGYIASADTTSGNAAEMNSNAIYNYNTSNDSIGIAANPVSASALGWNAGPVIFTSDTTSSLQAAIGFQSVQNYTDGRVTILKPLVVSGSLNVTAGITGSLSGTASFATTASFLLGTISSASYANNADVAVTASFATRFIVSTALTASGLNYPTADGLEGQVLKTDGTNDLSFGDVNTLFETIYTGENITKGDPLYISGSQGANPIVYKADAGNAAKMPVIYVASETVASGNTTRGIVLGLIEGINLTGYTAGTEIYVAVGGGWTSTRPTGSAIVQILGIVTKGGNGGKGLVLNPGPVELPNLQAGFTWVGDATGVPAAVSTGSINAATAISSSFATTASNANLLNGASSASFAQLGANNIFTGNQNTIQGNLFISGNLYVSGTEVVLSSSTLIVGDRIIEVNANLVNGPAGIYAFDATAPTTTGSLLWEPSLNYWVAGDAGSETKVITAADTGSLSVASASYALTASYAENAPVIDTGSFATTGSNQFNGNQTVTGSIAIDSTYKLITENVSANGGTLTIESTNVFIADPVTPGELEFYMGSNEQFKFTEVNNALTLKDDLRVDSDDTFFRARLDSGTGLYEIRNLNDGNPGGPDVEFVVRSFDNRIKIKSNDGGVYINDGVADFLTVPSGSSLIDVAYPISSSNGFTGSLEGTASFATNALSASYAPSTPFPFTGDAIITGSLTITGSVYGNINALSISSNTASMDLTKGDFFTLQLVSGSNTRIEPTNIRAGQTISLLLSTTGSATVSFPSSVKQVSGSSYTPTTTTSKDIVTLIAFDTTDLYLANVKNLI